MKLGIDKETYIKLGEAYASHSKYLQESYNAIRDVAKKFQVTTDFLGFPVEDALLMNAVLDIMGEEYAYWLYDCEGSFKSYNAKVTFYGKHPNARNLGDLYDLEMREEKK